MTLFINGSFQSVRVPVQVLLVVLCLNRLGISFSINSLSLGICLDLWEGAHLTWNFLYCYFALSVAPHTHPLVWQLMTHVSLVAPCDPLRTFLYDNRLSVSHIAINLYIFKGNLSFPLLISLINLCAQFTVLKYVVGR